MISVATDVLCHKSPLVECRRLMFLVSDASTNSQLVLVNMLALLVYSLLERQVQQAGLHVTAQRIVEQLEGATVIETHRHDGSALRRLIPLTAKQDALFAILVMA